MQRLVNMSTLYVVVMADGADHPSVNRTIGEAQAVLKAEGQQGWRLETRMAA